MKKGYPLSKKIVEKISFELPLLAFGVLDEMTKTDQGWCGKCPLPQHRTKEDVPTFSVDLQTRLFNCSGCKQNGDVIDFVSAFTEWGFDSATGWFMRYIDRDPEEVLTEARYDGEILKMVRAAWVKARDITI